MLLAAVLPNATYLGHGPTAPPHGHADEALVAEHDGATDRHDAPVEQEDEHARHCHVGPSKCGGSQSTVGTWWVGDEAPEPNLGPLSPHGGPRDPEAAPGWTVRSLRPPRLGA